MITAQIFYIIVMFIGLIEMVFWEEWWIGLSLLLFNGFLFLGDVIRDK